MVEPPVSGIGGTLSRPFSPGKSLGQCANRLCVSSPADSDSSLHCAKPTHIATARNGNTLMQAGTASILNCSRGNPKGKLASLLYGVAELLRPANEVVPHGFEPVWRVDLLVFYRCFFIARPGRIA